jgi:2-(1,2-epoxy-1,2-dihydrophenyl)acetyl-CoA isomerase
MSTIKFSSQNNVGKITLNRPDVLNSFNRDMAMEMQAVLDDCASNKTLRAVLLTGTGRAFSAGQDLATATGKEFDLQATVRENYNPIIHKIRSLEKPVICAVNGVAAGAGANIALACDIVLAGSSASFIQAFSKIGLIPDSGGTFFLPRIIGLQRAAALMMLGDKISAEQALQYGMVYKVIPDDKLDEEAEKIAMLLASMPTRGLWLTKKLLNCSTNNNLAAQLEMEEELQGVAGNTYDYKEGIEAFLEKRKSVFKGE